MATLELGGRAFTVTPATAEDFKLLHPPLAALCGTDDPTLDQLRAAIDSVAGLRVVLAHMLRKYDPSVTAEWVAEQVPDAGTAYDISAALGRIQAHTPGD